MATPTLPCIRCGKELESVFKDADNQPSGGTEFSSYGHYGSAYDNMDDKAILINLCDDCLDIGAKSGAILIRTPSTRTEPDFTFEVWRG